MNMDLFAEDQRKQIKKQVPLADRIRPKTLEDFVGQEHIVGKGKILRKMIDNDKLISLILWGPPGSGKTTLARIIAHLTKSHFIQFSAVTSGIADVKRVIREAKNRLRIYNQRTILFIDEIHRFNKTQQDTFLPHVENGTITLIGATTENPSFEVIGPLLSRTRIFTLKRLTPPEIKKILNRAIKDKSKGLGQYKIKISPQALDLIIQGSNGDARIALNAVEVAVETTSPDKEGVHYINLKTAE